MSRVVIEAQEAQSTDEIEIALFQIDHASLDTPVRLASGYMERLSDNPISYGVRSSWLGANPVTEPYLYILMSAELPGDMEEGASAAAIIIDNVDRSIGDTLRSVTDRADVQMAVVSSSDLNTPILEVTGLKLMEADGANGEHTLRISREPIEDEAAPTDRMTRDRFPGLFL